MAEKISRWSLKGELALSCNCDVFCPCVVSLGEAKPTQGYCQAWLAVQVDEGKFGRTNLAGVTYAAMLDIPGRMGEGGWSVALYIDDKASAAQVKAIEAIMSGQARGTAGVLGLLVTNFLGTKRVPVSYEANGNTRTVMAGRHVMGTIQQIASGDGKKPVEITNSSYWISPDVIIAEGVKSRVRDFGRVWTFDGKSAEICSLNWHGP